eukprot:3938999-Pyramimonas_sp.AAC.1
MNVASPCVLMCFGHSVLIPPRNLKLFKECRHARATTSARALHPICCKGSLKTEDCCGRARESIVFFAKGQRVGD